MNHYLFEDKRKVPGVFEILREVLISILIPILHLLNLKFADIIEQTVLVIRIFRDNSVREHLLRSPLVILDWQHIVRTYLQWAFFFDFLPNLFFPMLCPLVITFLMHYPNFFSLKLAFRESVLQHILLNEDRDRQLSFWARPRLFGGYLKVLNLVIRVVPRIVHLHFGVLKVIWFYHFLFHMVADNVCYFYVEAIAILIVFILVCMGMRLPAVGVRMLWLRILGGIDMFMAMGMRTVFLVYALSRSLLNIHY